MGDKFFNVIGLLLAIAMVTAVVGSKNSSSVINAMGSAFSTSVNAALGHSATK